MLNVTRCNIKLHRNVSPFNKIFENIFNYLLSTTKARITGRRRPATLMKIVSTAKSTSVITAGHKLQRTTLVTHLRLLAVTETSLQETLHHVIIKTTPLTTIGHQIITEAQKIVEPRVNIRLVRTKTLTIGAIRTPMHPPKVVTDVALTQFRKMTRRLVEIVRGVQMTSQTPSTVVQSPKKRQNRL